MGILGSSGQVKFGDCFCVYLEKEMSGGIGCLHMKLWRRQNASQLCHVPKKPAEARDPQGWSVPWAGLGQHARSLQLDYFLLMPLSTPLLYNYCHLLPRTFLSHFSAWQTPTQHLRPSLCVTAQKSWPTALQEFVPLCTYSFVHDPNA